MLLDVGPLHILDQGPLLGDAGVGDDDVEMVDVVLRLELGNSVCGTLLAAGVVADRD